MDTASLAVDPGLGKHVIAQGASAAPRSVRVRLEPYQRRRHGHWPTCRQRRSRTDGRGRPSASSSSRRRQTRTSRCAVWALANLAVHDKLKLRLSDLNAVAKLLRLLPARADELTEKGEQALTQIVRCVANLVVASENRQRVIECDGLPALLRSLECPYDSVKEAATRAFVNLSFESEYAHKIMLAGGLPAIVRCLSPAQRAAGGGLGDRQPVSARRTRQCSQKSRCSYRSSRLNSTS